MPREVFVKAAESLLKIVNYSVYIPSNYRLQSLFECLPAEGARGFIDAEAFLFFFFLFF